MEKFTDRNIYVTTDGRKEPSTEPLYQMLLKNNSTQRLASSTFTGARSTMGDDEPIECGDMDPSFRRLLESSPAVLEAYKTFKNPKKMAKLDVSTRTFQPSTDVEVPAFSSTVTIPDTVKSDDIKAVIQHYHDTSAQPSLELLSKHIREEVTQGLGRIFGTADPDLRGSRATEKTGYHLQCSSFHYNGKHLPKYEVPTRTGRTPRGRCTVSWQPFADFLYSFSEGHLCQ